MSEAGGIPPGGGPQAGESYGDGLARIQAAVDAGDTDLSPLGFWRLVTRLKLDPPAAEEWADRAGRIDRGAFEARVRPLYAVWLGNLVLAFGVFVGAAAAAYGLRSDNPTAAGLAFIVAAGAWSASVHDLAHWAAGRLSGIRFLAYFFGGPFPPRPGLKIDYATYLRASPGARARMHAAGALATKIAPFVALGFALAADAPLWSILVIVAVGVFQIVTDILFSTTSSDWKRVRRERAVARELAARRG